MPTDRPDEVVIELHVAPARRLLGVATVIVLGALLAWFAIRLPAAWPLRILLLLMGAGALWFAVRLWEASRLAVVLTRERLTDSSGRVLAELDDVAGVDRGALAAKPSNGFVVRTRTRQPAAWAPGVWWRVGRRVGVGGLTSAGRARAMAELLQAVLAERGSGGD